MPKPIPEAFLDLFEKKAFAHLATVMPDGSPQVSPVWMDLDGDVVRVNSAVGRVKDQNIRRNPNVALSIVDPENPYRFLLIRGQVVEITQYGADAHIDALAKKYLELDEYPYRQPGEVRVIYRICPEQVTGR